MNDDTENIVEDNEDEQKTIFIKEYGLDEDTAEKASELMDEGLDEDEAAELAELI